MLCRHCFCCAKSDDEGFNDVVGLTVDDGSAAAVVAQPGVGVLAVSAPAPSGDAAGAAAAAVASGAEIGAGDDGDLILPEEKDSDVDFGSVSESVAGSSSSSSSSSDSDSDAPRKRAKTSHASRGSQSQVDASDGGGDGARAPGMSSADLLVADVLAESSSDDEPAKTVAFAPLPRPSLEAEVGSAPLCVAPAGGVSCVKVGVFVCAGVQHAASQEHRVRQGGIQPRRIR